MQIHELNERKVRQQNRAKAGIASQLIKKANANSQAKLTQQAQQAAPTSTPAVSSTNVVSGGPTPAEQEKLNARIAAATAAQPTANLHSNQNRQQNLRRLHKPPIRLDKWPLRCSLLRLLQAQLLLQLVVHLFGPQQGQETQHLLPIQINQHNLHSKQPRRHDGTN